MENSHECTVLWVSLTKVSVKIETENVTHKVQSDSQWLVSMENMQVYYLHIWSLHSIACARPR